MVDFYTNTTNINNELRNITDNSDQSIAAIDPLLVKALILYKKRALETIYTSTGSLFLVLLVL